MRQRALPTTSFCLYLCILFAGSTPALAQTTTAPTTTKTNAASETVDEQRSSSQSARTTTKTRSTKSSEVATGAKSNEDYGPFTGNKDSDAYNFATTDYSTLEMNRIMQRQYEGPYVSYPTTSSPGIETVTTSTEGEFCLVCVLSQMQIPPINLNGSLGGSGGSRKSGDTLSGGIPLNTVTSYSNQTPDAAMKTAIKHMCEYVKKNPSCGPNKHAVVSDVSRGTGSIRTSIIDISTCDSSGNAKVLDHFPTGGGSGGIGNIPQSHATPPGFFKLTASGLNTRKNWPTCSNGNGFNYFLMEGQGCKYGASGESCQNTNSVKREILYHTWPQIGASTWGCTGVPQDRFCSWGDKIKGSCLYNYIGS